MRRETRHSVLRSYLYWCARTNPSKHLDTFEKYTQRSLYVMRKKQNFYLGGVFRARRGPYTVLWIDPNTYELLVVNRIKHTASWKPLYGFLI